MIDTTARHLRVHLVVAARPNFMKAAPLFHALRREPWCDPVLVHTGQHYDHAMADVFFEELGIERPDVNLGIGSGSHAEQTGGVLIAYERHLLKDRPDLVVVCGDVNATPAAALAAVKMGIPVAHLEAGLRSFDRTMPEEINRVVTDTICDYLWTPSADADANLLHEGIPAARIVRAGNIMIDSLEMLRPRLEASTTPQQLGLNDGAFAVVTLHRPSNVDIPERLARLCEVLRRCATTLPLVFPVHPRTRERLDSFGLRPILEASPSIVLTDPLPYCAFMRLIVGCQAVITDSGGVQEETSYLGIPCLTLRENTERPVTIQLGTNRLVKIESLPEAFVEASAAPRRPASIEGWDGQTASRITAWMRTHLATSDNTAFSS